MKRFIALLLVFYYSGSILAQNNLDDNAITVMPNNNINFSYQSIDDVLTDKVIDNAVSVSVSSKKSKCLIYAQVVFTGADQSEAMARRICLKLRNSTSTNFSPVNYASPVALSIQPVLLFEQDKATNLNLFNYDVVLKKQTGFDKTGSHNFTITFSLVEP
ncbi:hypothetical protein [Taibaiella soli]|uniref:Uncharacterized protein n=1 Tax=Taibaiella soli TaxID=1649169 RepID=A0A2W2AGR8_9BACT|nr:hypothetical protein [Taibaiella soli]PZF74685.1 hypothetical protein DN068_00360 [Taibaiella soli]